MLQRTGSPEQWRDDLAGHRQMESTVAPTIATPTEPPPAVSPTPPHVSEPAPPPAGSVRVAAPPPHAPAAVVAFRDWAREYFLAPPDQREKLIEQGAVLAKDHTTAIARMIPQNPKAAIENAVPMVVRQDLPAKIVSLLEERVNRKGELTLWATTPDGDTPRETAYYRTFQPVGGESRKAYVYGSRAAERTLSETLVHGIAAAHVENGPKLVAVAEERVRTLEIGERPDAAKAQSFTCPVSGESTAAEQPLVTITEETPAFEDETTVHYVCMGGHIGLHSTLLFDEETRAHWAKLTQRSSTAAMDDNIAYEGATGGPISPVTVPSTWTTGLRKVLFMRVTFPDHYQDPQSETDAYELMRQVSEEMTAMSYGRTYFQTTVTPLLVLSRTQAWLSQYEDDGGNAVGLIYDEARKLAKAAGYDTDSYDLDVCRWNGSVGDFGGAAAVGGKFFADKVGTKSVSIHEFGHNFGLMHANAFKGNPPSITGPGYSLEYANFWDWMGGLGEGGHFVVPTKAQLGWLPREGQVLVQQSGTYRIHQADQSVFDPAKRYALRVPKDGERDYWFEFRPTHPSNTGMQNGLLTTLDDWGSIASGDIPNGTGSGPLFLDMTPGSWRSTMEDTRQDGMLVIGRSFFDEQTKTCVTPIAKNATSPPNIDVTVNIGTFPGNNAPTQTLTASETSVSTYTNVNLSTIASDVDGDTLAYAWDFGDGTFSINNSSIQSKSWKSTGHYVVRCTVSDMKGKTHTSKILITVGAPGTYTISGTVTGPGGIPLEGVQVATRAIDLPSNSYFINNGFKHPYYLSYRSGYTDSNGHYIITGVASGSHTLYANLYPYSLIPAFTNPVSVSSHVTDADWNGTDLPALQISAIDADGSEAGDTGLFRITRSGSTTSALLVQVLKPSGTATLGTDCTLSPAPAVINGAHYFNIPAGNTALDVLVSPINDATSEGVEQVTLTIANSAIGYRISGSPAASVGIVDDESSQPVVSLTSTDTWISEPDDHASLLLARTGSTAAPLTVYLAYSGTAQAGADYSTVASLTIPAGQISASFPINVLNDLESEGTETVTVALLSDAGYQRNNEATTVTVDLNDDDIQTVSISAADAIATESGDPGFFTITRSGIDFSRPLTVDYSVNGSALHGKDYARLEGQAVIAAGETETSIRISPYNDTIGEGDQTVTLTLRCDGRYLVGTPQSATVAITDDDTSTFQIRNLATERLEPVTGATISAVFRIQRPSTGNAVTVNYTVSGSATVDSDFTSLSGTVSFSPTDKSKDISLSILADAELENSESVTLTLSPDISYQIAPFDNAATAVIIDADQPQLAVTAADAGSFPPAVYESSSSIRFFVSRNTNTVNPLTVHYTVSGTATSGADFTGATGSVTIPSGANGEYITFIPVNDSAAEGDETIVLTLDTDDAYGLRSASATIFLLDNDSFAGGTPLISFASDASTVAEIAGTHLIPVTLTGTPAVPVTVHYAINGGSADSSDVTLASGILTFGSAGTQNLPLVITPDGFPETAETVKITLRHAYRAAIGINTHVVTITDVARPEAFTRPPEDALANSAVLHGEVIPHGQDTLAYFEWGTSPSYGNTSVPQSIGNGQAAVAVAQSITGLSAGQTYHFRVVATNASGTSYGNNRMITSRTLPVVETRAASNRTQTTARLNSSVNPNGQVTHVWFEWGGTLAYGNFTPPQSVGSGSEAVSASMPVTGLIQGSTYHFRAVAMNASGISYGTNQTFIPASLDTAGMLYVNVRASNATAGASIWGSSGTLADFTKAGSPTRIDNVAATGIPGVQFDGTTTAYNGPNSVPDIHAASDRTIEVWFYNPAGEVTQESLVTLGRQGSTLSLLGLSAGSSLAAHFASDSALWNTTPAYGSWHHVVLVYDGAQSVSFYVDGALTLTKNLTAALNTQLQPVTLGSSRSSGGSNNWGSYGFSGFLNTVRIHGGQLTAAQILNNYRYGPAISDAPEAHTQPATAVMDDRFTAHASVEPNGLETTAWIEYGTASNYGFQTSTTTISANSAPLDLTPVIFGSSGNTFHYRVVAQNSAGITYGKNQSTTLGPPASAGTLHVDLKATQPGAGTTTWPNSGSLGGNFIAIQNPSLVSNVLSTNVPGVQFNGTDNGYYGPNSPPDITGSSDRTIEVWTYNPSLSGFEVMVDVSRYTTVPRVAYNACGSIMHFLSGENVTWTGNSPALGTWNHLVYVYDGNTNVKGYVNGVLTTDKTIGGILATTAAQISLGSLRTGYGNSAGLDWSGYGFSGYLNTVRIHGGQLDASQVARNCALGPALPLAPAAYAATTEGVTTEEATLNGSVEPESLATTAWFEYGTTPTFGFTTTAQSIGSGSAPVAVSQTISGLTPNTLYHARMVAQNSAGTSYSSFVTFTTNAAGLASLGLSSGSLNPSFETDTLNYTATVPHETNSITLTPISNTAGATLAVNGITLDSGSPSPPIPLVVGANTIPVVVTRNGSRAYTLEVTRQSSFQSFMAAQGANGYNSDPMQDLDEDGIVNLCEFGFGMNPLLNSRGSLVVSGSSLSARGMPDLFTSSGPSPEFHARFVRRKDHATAGITYSVQFSADLSTWETSTATPSVVASDATHDAVTVPFPPLVNGKPPRFFRIAVSESP